MVYNERPYHFVELSADQTVQNLLPPIRVTGESFASGKARRGMQPGRGTKGVTGKVARAANSLEQISKIRILHGVLGDASVQRTHRSPHYR